MSASEAFTTPTTCALPVSATVSTAPSRDFTASLSPSTFSIVPRTRWVCGCWGKAGTAASMAARAAPAAMQRALLELGPLMVRLPRSHRRGDAVAADRDCGGLERAVVLLLGGGDEDLGARLELVLAAGNVGDDHGLGRDVDLLFPLLVLEGDLVAGDPL